MHFYKDGDEFHSVTKTLSVGQLFAFTIIDNNEIGIFIEDDMLWHWERQISIEKFINDFSWEDVKIKVHEHWKPDFEYALAVAKYAYQIK